MDDLNYTDLTKQARNDKDLEKLKKMVTYCDRFEDNFIPDPYYGGADGFDHVLDLLSNGCSNLIDELEKS